MQERRLSRARGRDQRDRLAGPDRELRLSKDFECDVALSIASVDAVEKENRGLSGAGLGPDLFPRLAVDRRVTHSAAPRPDRGALRAKPGRASPAATARGPSPLPHRARTHTGARADARGMRTQTRTA